MRSSQQAFYSFIDSCNLFEVTNQKVAVLQLFEKKINVYKIRDVFKMEISLKINKG